MIDPRGDLISDYVRETELDILTTDQILNELARFGFYVNYEEEPNLTKTTIQVLKTVKELEYDKIRLMFVHSNTDTLSGTIYVVAFNVASNEHWLNSGYSASQSEFTKAITEGTAFNVSNLNSAKSLDWSWLYNSVQDVTDIILTWESNN